MQNIDWNVLNDLNMNDSYAFFKLAVEECISKSVQKRRPRSAKKNMHVDSSIDGTYSSP